MYTSTRTVKLEFANAAAAEADSHVEGICAVGGAAEHLQVAEALWDASLDVVVAQVEVEEAVASQGRPGGRSNEGHVRHGAAPWRAHS